TGHAPPCHGSDLRISGDQIEFKPVNGGGAAFVPLVNITTKACSLSGRPTARMVHAVPPQQTSVAAPPLPAQWPEVFYPASTLNEIRRGERAAVYVSWNNWCDPQLPGKVRVPPKAMRFTLPRGLGFFDADYDSVPPCLDAKKPSELATGPFQPAVIT